MQQIRDSQMSGDIILSTKVEKSFDRRKWRSEYYLTRGLYNPEAILFFSLLKLFLSLPLQPWRGKRRNGKSIAIILMIYGSQVTYEEAMARYIVVGTRQPMFGLLAFR